MDSQSLYRVLDAVGRDARSSATDLVLVTSEAIREWGRETPRDIDDLPDILRKLSRVRPSMSAFLNLADRVRRAAEEAPPSRQRSAVGESAAEFGREVAASPRRLATRARELPDRAIATYSSGASVRAALLALHNQGFPIQVVLSESRPAMEGACLAEDLARAGVPVRLVIDAALPGQLPGVDALWLGADALGPAGLIHKVGSATLAREARHVGTPVRAFAAGSKWIGTELSHLLALEVGDAMAVHPGITGLEATNPLFDVTPWELLDTILCESGAVPAREARRSIADFPTSPGVEALRTF